MPDGLLRAELEAELARTRLLADLSGELIREHHVEALYEKVLDAAVKLMRADFGSMQMLYPERGSAGELRLLAFRGFDPEAARYWEWVSADSGCTCGIAMRTSKRVLIPDTRSTDLFGGRDRQAYVDAGLLAAQSTPLFSRDGRLLGMLSTHWAKPHVPTEQELRLFDILARQAADLLERTRVEAELREADRRKDRFIATLSHELRNPLAPLRAAVQLLQRPDPGPDMRGLAVEILDRQVSHMTRLVDDLLDIARITRDTLELRRARVDLAEVVNIAVEASKPLLEAGGHRMEMALPGAPLPADVDPVRLTQVLTNLLNNAAVYTARGGCVWVCLARQADAAEIRVRDNGRGITPEALPRIFDMFERGRWEGAGQGLGIGLALSRRLVELHDGTLEARSPGLDQGSEFVVRLPLAEKVSGPFFHPAK